MEKTLDSIFNILNRGIAAINAAKQVETGTPATRMTAITPVQLTPAQVAAQRSTKWLWIGGLALAAGLGVFFYLRRKKL
jgi:LPXTG-motif cell wall-anchored protein